MTHYASNYEAELKARNGIGATALDGKVYAVGGFDNERTHATALRFDPTTNEWEAVAPMGSARRVHATAAIDGKLYVAGGHDGEKVLDTVERFDPATNKWEAMAAMSTPRQTAGAAVLDGKLYVVGGHDGQAILSTVERYDPATNAWEPVTPMSLAPKCAPPAPANPLTSPLEGDSIDMVVEDGPVPIVRNGVAVTVLDGKLYAIGGFDGTKRVATMLCFDPAKNVWEMMDAAMGAGRNGHAALTHDGKIYVLGGHDGEGVLYTVQRFNPAKNEWMLSPHDLPNMGTPRVTPGAAILDDKLYLVGGYDGQACLSSVECSDPWLKNQKTHVIGEWYPAPPMSA